MARESQIGKWNSPSGLLRLQRLAMHGLTQAEICEQIGVPVRTFRRWCTQDPRIKKAISVGAEAALAAWRMPCSRKPRAETWAQCVSF